MFMKHELKNFAVIPRKMHIDAIAQIEARTGRPVISSTQALFWQSLRAAGIGESVEDCGMLFQHPLAVTIRGD